MPRIFCRSASTTASVATQQLLDVFRGKARTAPSIVRKQVIDATQTQRLSLTLDRPQLYQNVDIQDGHAPVKGTPLPPGYHLVYFTPAVMSQELGQDGIDVSYSPGEPFTRRMWAGGEIQWAKSNALRVGDEATETTQLVSAESKNTRAGEEMIVVRVEKTFENARGLALTDKRDWVFRMRLSGITSVQEDRKFDPSLLPSSHKAHQARDFLQKPVTLFRFSALTFNGHMIHYSRPWCREVEGHKGIVVHGPLNLINMLEFWRDTQEDDYKIPQSIKYRATAPFYAGEKYRALMEKHTDTTSIRLWGHDGHGSVRVGMLGDVAD